MKEYSPTEASGDGPGGGRIIFVELYVDSLLPAPQTSFALPLHEKMQSVSAAGTVPGENELPQ